MDFLLLLGRDRPAFPAEGVARSGAWPEFTITGVAGGLLAHTPTPYPGLGPVIDADGATLIVGDPLFDWVQAGDGPTARSAQIVERLRNEELYWENLRPFHSAAIIRCRRRKSARGLLAELRNDGMGGISLYRAEGPGFVALSNSPDLIALAIGAELDLVACREFVSQERVTFPYTMYHGITEVAPGTVLFVHQLSRRVAILETPVIIADGADAFSSDPSPVVASQLLGDHFAEFFRRLDLNLAADSSIGCTLSAGLDSRTVLAAAQGAFPGRLTAISGSPDENPELWTARRVAATLGIPQETGLWDPEPFIARFRDGRGLAVGSHRRWTDAHFQGASAIFSQRVVLGGYFSDSMMDGSDGPIAIRRAGIAAGSIAPGSHWNVISPHFWSLDTETQDEITDRADASLGRQNARLRGIDHLRYTMPAGRGIYSAHWIALSREWAQYEPFLTEGALAIAVASAPVHGPAAKRSVFASIIAGSGLGKIPVNPHASGAPRGRPWLSLKTVLATSPEFARAYRAMQRSALDLLGVDPAAVRLRLLLVNVYWANVVVTRWAPRRLAAEARGLRAAARRLRLTLAR